MIVEGGGTAVGREGTFDLDEVARELIDMGLSKEKRLLNRIELRLGSA